MKKEKKVFGTTEWAVKNANFISGCNHDCKYCYSKAMGIRFKRKTSANWEVEEVNTDKINKKVKKVDGFIMFPSSHDITPINLNYSVTFLNNLLNVGNKILIVTKPHKVVIEKICETFSDYKENILFRFTIGSKNSDTLKFWEPNAPSFEERKSCLIYAFNNGFATSVSCEPMLDDKIVELVIELEPWVTDSLWIGKPNFLLRRLKANGVDDKDTIDKAKELISLYSDEYIKSLYNELSGRNKIKWKESIKKVVQIEIPTTKGLDI